MYSVAAFTLPTQPETETEIGKDARKYQLDDFG